MLEEPKNSVLQSYKEPLRFKLMAVKNETVWGYHTVSVWGSCGSAGGQEKVKIFWKWRLHRWQIPLSVQMRLSKTKQPLSQRTKTNFPRIQPFLLPPFPQLLVHCQLAAPSALSSLWFSEKIASAACCCFPALATLLLQWTLHLPFPCSHSYSSFPASWFHPQFAVSCAVRAKDAASPYKTWLIHTSELTKLIASGVYSSQQHQARPVPLMIQFQSYVLPTAFAGLLLVFCDNLHLLHWDLL